jgi:hypothetical protein
MQQSATADTFNDDEDVDKRSVGARPANPFFRVISYPFSLLGRFFTWIKNLIARESADENVVKDFGAKDGLDEVGGKKNPVETPKEKVQKPAEVPVDEVGSRAAKGLANTAVDAAANAASAVGAAAGAVGAALSKTSNIVPFASSKKSLESTPLRNLLVDLNMTPVQILASLYLENPKLDAYDAPSFRSALDVIQLALLKLQRSKERQGGENTPQELDQIAQLRTFVRVKTRAIAESDVVLDLNLMAQPYSVYLKEILGDEWEQIAARKVNPVREAMEQVELNSVLKVLQNMEKMEGSSAASAASSSSANTAGAIASQSMSSQVVPQNNQVLAAVKADSLVDDEEEDWDAIGSSPSVA